MSSHRSSSGQGIRELRARFENRDDQGLIPSRRQSPSDDKSNNSTSKSPVGRRTVKTNFIAVEQGHLPLNMATNGVATTESVSSMANRRESFSEQDKNVVDELKKTVSTEAERRRSIPGMEEKAVPANAVTSAMPTPILEAPEPESPAIKNVAIPVRETQSEHTEKKTSAVEDEAAALKSADPKSIDAVSGQAEQAKNAVKNARQSSKPGAISTTSSKISRPSVASPTTTAKPSKPATARPSTTNTSATRASNGTSTLMSGTAASSSRAVPASTEVKPKPKPPTQTAPLPSHLTAPTASSKAKHEPEENKSRRVTSGGKPIETSSQLMAPTAASRAKHDSEGSSSSSASMAPAAARKAPAPAPKRDRTSNASVTNGVASRKPAGRPSLVGRANGIPTRQPETKPTTAATPGFFDRMMKPTTASLSKTHEKAEESTAAKNPGHAAPSGKTHEPSAKPAETKLAAARPSGQRSAPAVASKKSQANGTAAKPTSTTNTIKPSAKNPVLASTSEHSTVPPKAPTEQVSQLSTVEAAPLPPTAPTEQAAQPATPVAPSKAGVKPQQPSTPVQKVLPTNDGQQDQDWNAAALPLTPQSQKQNGVKQTGAVASTNGNTATESSAAAKARRSLMETPDLATNTIH